jgi:hypothetical protein
MKQNTGLLIRIVWWLLGAVFFALVIYHAWNTYKPSSIRTETVFEYTVSRSVNGVGVAIRQEQIIPGGSNSGISNYLFGDGERVTVGQTVAEFYTNASNSQDIKRMRDIEQEIALLKEAQDTTINNFINADVINRNLKDELSVLVSMSSTGRYTNLQTVRVSVQSLINKRQVSTNSSDGFEERISELQAEHTLLSATTSQASVSRTAAPLSGYFSHVVDGCEGLVPIPKELPKMTAEELLALIDNISQKETTLSHQVGKLVTDPNWFFVFQAPAHETEWIAVGNTVGMRFEGLSSEVPATVAGIALYKDAEDAIVLLQCNSMNGELINLRRAEATIFLREYSGLRINNAAIRFNPETNETGVYVLEDKVVVFKRINPIYKDTNFVLAEWNTFQEDETLVRLYDQMIVSGNDLYDGKILK